MSAFTRIEIETLLNIPWSVVAAMLPCWKSVNYSVELCDFSPLQGTILVRCQWLLATRLSFLKTTAAVGFECARMANKDIFPSLMSSSDDRSQIEHKLVPETRKGYLSRSIMQAHFFISEYTPGIWLDVGLTQLFFLFILYHLPQLLWTHVQFWQLTSSGHVFWSFLCVCVSFVEFDSDFFEHWVKGVHCLPGSSQSIDYQAESSAYRVFFDTF